MPHARFATAALLLALSAPALAAAQVGHPPDASPYDDMRVAQYLTISGTYLTGGEGSAGVGPTDGRLGGVGWDLRIGGPTYVHLGLAAGQFQRTLIDPTQGAATRVLGTVSQSMFLADAGVGLVLTGQKTWHGFAPYVGASVGLALGGSVPADSLSGFTFSTRFHVGPVAGLRWHPTERLHLRVEGRDMLWRLRYPAGFFSPPANALGEPPLLDNAQIQGGQWVHHPTLVLSVGYALRM